MLSLVISCRHCGSSNLKANGHAPSGRQRYCCRDCQRSGTADAVGRAYPESFRAQVLAAYQERCSMRGVCRIFGISRTTLIDWLKKSR